MVPFSPWIRPMGNEGYCGAIDATLSVTKCRSLEVTVDLIDCWLLNECRSECQGKALEKKMRVNFEAERVSLSVYSYLENTQVRLCPTERTRDVETNKHTHTKNPSSLRCTCKGAELPTTTFQKGSKSWPPEAFVPPAAWGRRTGGRAACRTPPTGGERNQPNCGCHPSGRWGKDHPTHHKAHGVPLICSHLALSLLSPTPPPLKKKKINKKKSQVHEIIPAFWEDSSSRQKKKKKSTEHKVRGVQLRGGGNPFDSN